METTIVGYNIGGMGWRGSCKASSIRTPPGAKPDN